jgi:gamma-glutamylaminecyclotransferase
MTLLFVYGSLKEGYPNFHVNKGRRVPGDFITALPHPFYLFKGQLPCLLPPDGSGLQVRGQVFEVGPAELAQMDALERVGQPGGYSRVAVDVLPAQGPAQAPLACQVYLQDAALMAQPGPHLGPLDEYTLAHARLLRW